MPSRDRGRGLLRTLQWRRPDRSDVPFRQPLRRGLGLSLPSLGQVVPGQTSVDDAFRVLDFTVPDEMDGRGHRRKANL